MFILNLNNEIPPIENTLNEKGDKGIKIIILNDYFY
jgi:hypothetical protein